MIDIQQREQAVGITERSIDLRSMSDRLPRSLPASHRMLELLVVTKPDGSRENRCSIFNRPAIPGLRMLQVRD